MILLHFISSYVFISISLPLSIFSLHHSISLTIYFTFLFSSSLIFNQHLVLLYCTNLCHKFARSSPVHTCTFSIVRTILFSNFLISLLLCVFSFFCCFVNKCATLYYYFFIFFIFFSPYLASKSTFIYFFSKRKLHCRILEKLIYHEI